MESVEKHIQADKEIFENPTTSPQQRRHIEEELHELEVYVENHKEELKQVTITTPAHLNCCEAEPSAPECKVYDD